MNFLAFFSVVEVFQAVTGKWQISGFRLTPLGWTGGQDAGSPWLVVDFLRRVAVALVCLVLVWALVLSPSRRFRRIGLFYRALSS